jgi:hypothetical protein
MGPPDTSGEDQQAGEVLDTYRTTALPAGVTMSHRTSLDQVARMLRSGSTTQAKTAWAEFCKSYFTKSNTQSLRQIQRWVVKQGFIYEGSPLQTTIGSWEREKRAVGANAQVADVDLRDMLNMESRLFQTLSNVIKTMHDTANAIIQNIRS